MHTEEWRLSEAPGVEVSNTGKVRDAGSGEPLTVYRSGKKAAYRSIRRGGRMWLIHRLVAKAFIPNPMNLPVVMHIDDDGANNEAGNLRWGTTLDNNRDRADKGRTRNQHMTKAACIHGHPLAGENLYMRTARNGRMWRVCRTCHDADAARRAAAKRKPPVERAAHGSRWGYRVNGCRCAECVAWNRQRVNDQRNRSASVSDR